MTEETKVTAADNYGLLSLLYDIRVAAGDKEGRLMQSELLARISALRADAERLREIESSCRKVYAAIPSLPVTLETADAATDALHSFCVLIGVHAIDVEIRDAALADQPAEPKA